MPRIILTGFCNEVLFGYFVGSYLFTALNSRGWFSNMNKNIKLILNYFVGPVVFCILLYSIYMQLQRQPDWKDSLLQVWHSLNGADDWKIGIVLLLMFINWGLEARKWQLAVKRVEDIRFFNSFRAIFAGTTLGFFTPNRMGEYLGRMWFIREGRRLRSISLTLVCSMAQLLVTLSAGCVGIYFLRQDVLINPYESSSMSWWLLVIQYAAIFSVLLLSLLYFRLSWLIRLVEKLPINERWVRNIRVLDNFNATHLLRILSLSVIRYLVFMLQYYILLNVFGVSVNWWQTFWSISVVFLMMAIIPTLAFLTELGVRWKASIQLVSVYSNNLAGIFASSVTIWAINLVIPALIGSLLILGIKFFRNK